MRKPQLIHTTLSTYLIFGLAIALTAVSSVHAGSGLVSPIDAQRSGLERSWFSQAELDRTRHRVENVVLDGDTLFVLSTAGVMHAMDAETGRTNWVARIGNPNYPSLGPTANDNYVALVNGAHVTVLDRNTGVEHLSRELGGGAGGGPAISNGYIYVPMFTGKVEAYALEDEDENELVWYYASTGRVFQPATATPQSVVWPTQRGFLYVANPEANGVRYRFETAGLVNSDPASFDGKLMLSTSNGYVFALNELTGQQLWRYSTGSSLTSSPVAIGDTVYVASEAPALHAVSIANGQRKWSTGGIDQLAGVRQTRVYGMNRRGDLVTMDLASGVPLSTLRTSPDTTAVVNTANDRIYLVNETGLVQCLHEIGADQPYMHPGQAPPPADAPADQPGEQAPAEQPAEPAAQPEVDNPFDGGAANPFDTGPADDSNPFGGGEEIDNPFDF